MFARKSESNMPRSLGLAWCATSLVLLMGCTSVTSRLDAKFDTDVLGALPSSAPAPTPPSDLLVWRTGSVTPTVVARTASDRWVRAVPLPTFIASPDSRQIFLIATTEAFTTSPPANIRGSVRLRLNGLGSIGIGVRSLQSGRPLDFIGGMQLSNFLLPIPSEVDALQTFSGTRLSDSIGLPSAGQISGYTSGNVIDINWTIDQASRTFSASVLGGPSRSNTFPAVSAGVATTPVQQLMLFVWLEKPTSATTAFIDNLSVEEYR